MIASKNFTTSIVVDNTPAEVFNAIVNVAGWWQGEVIGSSLQLNDSFTYRMAPHHFTRQQVIEFTADKKLVWLITESSINFVADKNEWLNTKIVFEISTVGNKTKLTFTHEGLVPKFECYGGCSGAWKRLIEESLYCLVTTGKGKKVF